MACSFLLPSLQTHAQNPSLCFPVCSAAEAKRKPPSRLLVITRASTGSESTSRANPQQQQQQDKTPSWAQPGSDEAPPWETKQAVTVEQGFEVPFYAYLLASSVVTIAAIGSIFEYFNKKPVFGVIFPDSPLYTPILGFFAVTGFPTAAFLFFKSTEMANKAARDQDREDGFLD